MEEHHSAIAPEMDLSIPMLQYALYLLAAEPTEQIQYLDRMCFDLDELGLQLHDHFEPDKARPYYGFLSSQQLAAVGAVYAGMPAWERSDLWQIEALTHEVWATVRLQARAALQAFGFRWHASVLADLTKSWPAPELIIPPQLLGDAKC